MYTVQKLARLAGVSARTLRYYDSIGLLTPQKNESGYRLYGSVEIDRLQLILFYRELGFGLQDIAKLLDDPDFDETEALIGQRKLLLEERSRLDLLITNVEKTISTKQGESRMANHEKFEGFKKQLVDDNEAAYGKEIREKYSNAEVDRSNAKMLGMDQEQYEAFKSLEQEILEKLEHAVKEGKSEGILGQEIADLHRQWLGFTWGSYEPKAHAGLAEMYVADERFAAYYEKAGEGAAQYLRDAIIAYTDKLNE
ncbi:MerR family transcriptional regulator [Planococcus sp. CP5-4]|uniref:MerR family transcriptional regulator n=1 Tax=unclassified Planococcus (in: firmicutes) TaxID=2662419 RepID=UPI001C22EE40|nr:MULTISPECIES: MerR family transcriptional regulator [unclassified Planococcus (in: firmicutes)]MBU9672557.1 MerR family transcriptional regulator [Planococcus sp. CP5-4_YE]MBV0909607.1 MerR family transcriptional regulator [Planococcus sp. CP5-4_UN]MBW6064337.1 MerR family transcriptional regulator [Planococcus sp. CP5-4]